MSALKKKTSGTRNKKKVGGGRNKRKTTSDRPKRTAGKNSISSPSNVYHGPLTLEQFLIQKAELGVETLVASAVLISTPQLEAAVNHLREQNFEMLDVILNMIQTRRHEASRSPIMRRQGFGNQMAADPPSQPQQVRLPPISTFLGRSSISRQFERFNVVGGLATRPPFGPSRPPAEPPRANRSPVVLVDLTEDDDEGLPVGVVLVDLTQDD